MIVAVAGGKGGVGKSTVSLNLGRALDAVVVDADLAIPDLPDGPGSNLHDVLAGRADPMDAVQERGSLRVVPCGRTLAGARASNISEFPGAVGAIERRCGRVVVDCPAGLARDVGVQLHCADVAVLVTIASKPALMDALRTRELARTVDTPVAAVAVNKSTASTDETVAENVEAKMGAPATVVEKRSAVADAKAAGKPVRDYRPDSPAVESFEVIAERIRDCERRLSGCVGVL